LGGFNLTESIVVVGLGRLLSLTAYVGYITSCAGYSSRCLG